MKGYWSLPGGRIEPGEHPRDAAIRELREETRIVGRQLRLVGITRPVRWENGQPKYANFSIFTYLALDHEGIAIAGDDAADLVWTDLDTDHGLQLTSNIIPIVRLAREISLTET